MGCRHSKRSSAVHPVNSETSSHSESNRIPPPGELRSPLWEGEAIWWGYFDNQVSCTVELASEKMDEGQQFSALYILSIYPPT